MAGSSVGLIVIWLFWGLYWYRSFIHERLGFHEGYGVALHTLCNNPEIDACATRWPNALLLGGGGGGVNLDSPFVFVFVRVGGMQAVVRARCSSRGTEAALSFFSFFFLLANTTRGNKSNALQVF